MFPSKIRRAALPFFGRWLLILALAATFLSPSLSALADSNLVQQALHALQGGGAQSVPPPAAVDVAFSPGGGATDLVLKAIASAKKSVHVAAYALTSRPIAKALAEAHKTGVDVRVVIDHEQVRKQNHSVAPWLASQNVPVRVDIVHELQHDKYMVIDGKNVETGSFNYTAAAEQHNSENVVVLWGAPQLAAAFESDWKSLWDQAEIYGGQ